jgi:hypothetical protein
LMMKENNVKPLPLEFPITYLAMGCSIVGISQDESNDRWSHWNLRRPKTHQSWLMFGNPPHYGTRTCLICELHKLSKYMGIHSIFKFMLEDLRFWELVAGCFLRIEYRVSARAIGPAQPLSWLYGTCMEYVLHMRYLGRAKVSSSLTKHLWCYH